MTDRKYLTNSSFEPRKNGWSHFTTLVNRLFPHTRFIDAGGGGAERAASAALLYTSCISPRDSRPVRGLFLAFIPFFQCINVHVPM